MPKSYSEKEKLLIIEQLQEVAMQSMLKNGIKKTTVDDLVESVHIPKGTFYLFYKSKELLLYDALMKKEEEIHSFLTSKLTEIKLDFSIASLSDLLFEFFKIGYNIGILPIMMNGELDILMRKLPDEIVKEHIAKDNSFLSVFKELFPTMTSNKLDEFSAAFRAVFFTAIYKREIGEDYECALKLLIRGLVLQMCEVKDDRN